MSKESAFEYLKQFSKEKDIIYFDSSSATVHLAAELLGCEDNNILKTMAFMGKSGALLIVSAGLCRIDNQKFKGQFETKAKFLSPEELLTYIGHEAGGVCPFGIPDEVPVYLDESIKKLDGYVYPAAGTSNSAVKLEVKDLDILLPKAKWVDVCKDIEEC